jgi:hypothetical protein
MFTFKIKAILVMPLQFCSDKLFICHPKRTEKDMRKEIETSTEEYVKKYASEFPWHCIDTAVSRTMNV